MKDILSKDNLVRVNQIKDTIKDKDIRTHSQLKAEMKKSGIDINIQKNAKGNVQSYSITEKGANGQDKLKLDSVKGQDREFMKQFDNLIKDNRDKAISNAKEPKTVNEKQYSEFMEKANAHLKTNLDKEVAKRKSEIER